MKGGFKRVTQVIEQIFQDVDGAPFVSKGQKQIFDNMAKKAEPYVKRDEQNPEPIEIIARSIVQVDDAMKKIMAGPLKLDTIVLLLQDSIGPRNITQKQIRLVLHHAAALKVKYVK